MSTFWFTDAYVTIEKERGHLEKGNSAMNSLECYNSTVSTTCIYLKKAITKESIFKWCVVAIILQDLLGRKYILNFQMLQEIFLLFLISTGMV